MAENPDRRIAVLTGTRAEYGLLQSSMERIRNHEKLSLQVIATGMHLSPKHGMTVDQIREDGFSVDREVLMQVDGDSGAAMAKSLGVGTIGLVDALSSLEPDILLLLGDRDEALAGALAAAHMNIPVAHIHGGDSHSGAIIDESIRHAITKFSHIHFPASERSAERITQLGEEEWRITTVGGPGLDAIREGRYTDPETLRTRLDLSTDRPLITVLQHPVTSRPERAGEEVVETLDAVSGMDTQVVIIYPNSDAGSDRMIAEIESREFDRGTQCFENLPHADFLGLLAISDAMVGNSSSALIEAPSLDLPAVDIGPRQAGRQRGNNTISVEHDSEKIRTAIKQCLTDESFREEVRKGTNPYDKGGSGNLICDQLAEISLDERLMQKEPDFD